MFKNMKKGFTLIELLVVIAIIGILSSAVLVSLNTARVKAKDVTKKSDLRQIQLAMTQVFDDSGTYAVEDAASCVGVTSCILDASVATYFPSGPPLDPQPKGNDYLFYGNGTSFCISADLDQSGKGGFACDEDQCREITEGNNCDTGAAVDKADTAVSSL